jgi:hypothetical protein
LEISSPVTSFGLKVIPIYNPSWETSERLCVVPHGTTTRNGPPLLSLGHRRRLSFPGLTSKVIEIQEKFLFSQFPETAPTSYGEPGRAINSRHVVCLVHDQDSMQWHFLSSPCPRSIQGLFCETLRSLSTQDVPLFCNLQDTVKIILHPVLTHFYHFYQNRRSSDSWHVASVVSRQLAQLSRHVLRPNFRAKRQ